MTLLEPGMLGDVQRALALACLLQLAVSAARAVEVPSSPPAREQSRLVYLLQYVGSDYAGAVQDGKIVNASEYGEVLGFTREMIRGATQTGMPESSVLSGLRRLEQRILDLAPSDEVYSLSRQILPDLARAVDALARPAAPPDLEKGAFLWRRDCAACHGDAGAGDGWAAPGMEPRPIPLRDPLQPLSPRQIHGAITFGIDGTAMPSFEGAYDDAEVWALAFFAMTLRDGFAPKPPPPGLRTTLDELVDSTNSELLSKLRRTWPEASTSAIDFLRANPSYSDAPLATTRARADRQAAPGISVARELQDAFAAVARRVLPAVVGVAGYVNDPAWHPDRLRADKGDGWITANQEALLYPGFRPARFGSGFIVDPQGYLLTSNKLLRDERDAVVPFADVEMADGTHIAANVVGTEPTLDLAVLRVFDQEERLADAARGVEFAAGDPLQIGQWLIALGDPTGPEKVFAVGVVAAPPSRQCYQEQLSATLVQSALVIPSGAAGGPVLDIEGRIVGIGVEPRLSTTVLLPADSSSNVRILPIQLALNLFEALKVAQSHRSPWIGTSVLERTELLQRLPRGSSSRALPHSGIAIDDVFDPSPASRAGVKPGDFLLSLGGHKLFAVPEFQQWLYVLGIGAKVELELLRGEETFKIELTIEPRPESATSR